MVNGAVVVVKALTPSAPSAPGTETDCGVAQQVGWQGVVEAIKLGVGETVGEKCVFTVRIRNEQAYHVSGSVCGCGE